ncbi:MAG: TolC family protein [Pseudomonadota bacterium]|nr:TolC family protein [Pseudomonadota bacterium]
MTRRLPSPQPSPRGRGRFLSDGPRLAVLAAALLLALPARADDLPTLIRDALAADPAILEARANEEVADSQLEATRAQHWPVLGLQAGSNLVNPNDHYGTPFRGVAGRMNLYSAGAISAAIERDEHKAQYQRLKTEDTSEQLAFNVASLYMQALASKELLAAETANLARHQKIIDDLTVIVDNDGGRRYELVQAESRALQVRTRMVQHEKTMRLALSKLTRYSSRPATLVNPLADDWQASLPADALEAPHPGLLALEREANAVRAEQSQLSRSRWPRIDLEAGVGNNGYARLVANWNFFDRSADYTVTSASKQIIAAERRQDLMQRELSQMSDTAKADMAQSQLQIKSAEQQIDASAEVAKLYEMQFKVGRRSLIELVNAYAELASVEVSRVLARNDWRNAVINYLHAHAALTDWAKAQAQTPATPQAQQKSSGGDEAPSPQPDAAPSAEAPAS